MRKVQRKQQLHSDVNTEPSHSDCRQFVVSPKLEQSTKHHRYIQTLADLTSHTKNIHMSEERLKYAICLRRSQNMCPLKS